MSWARWRQAKAIERMAMAGLFPQVNAQASASRSQNPPINLGNQQIESPERNNFGLSTPVSYEVDLWGRVRSGYLAAEQDTVAFRADVETAAMTVAASVTERWFDVVEQRALKVKLAEQLVINRTNLELAELRFKEGDAALSDVYTQQQNVQRLEAAGAQLTTVELVAQQQLAVLLGKPASKLVSDARTELPLLPPLPKQGIPATLLERRPDLRAAKARVVAADYRVAQAIAQRLPSLTLSGSLGFSATELSKLFESFVWSIAGSISGVIWDGGRLDAEIERSNAALDERAAAYGHALLTALVEVESSLASERLSRKRIKIQALRAESARRAHDSARRRFAAGIGSYLSVLAALQSMEGAEQDLLQSRRQLLSQRIQLYRALGSGWTRELKPPDEHDDEDDKVGTEEEAS
jgi:NodT family efflux transporter outer membrane factor (OMF) lipoprotein